MPLIASLRLEIHQHAGNYINLGEIALYDVDGNSLDLSGTSVSASSTHFDFTPDKTIDFGVNCATDSWSSAHTSSISEWPVWIQWDFSTPQPIQSVALINASDCPESELITEGSLLFTDTQGNVYQTNFTCALSDFTPDYYGRLASTHDLMPNDEIPPPPDDEVGECDGLWLPIIALMIGNIICTTTDPMDLLEPQSSVLLAAGRIHLCTNETLT